MTTKLSVNVNKFALLRNSRGNDYPNVVAMARRAIEAGVHGITVHPRPDQRHVRYSDVPELSKLVRSYPGVEFNIEGNPIPEFLDLVLEVGPHQCTLVPDAGDQLTSDHGWILGGERTALAGKVRVLSEAGIRVSLFMDPIAAEIEHVPSVGAERIELYTETYARAHGTEQEDAVFGRFRNAASRAQDLGLGVNAGHDLNLTNLGPFLAIPGILEVSIGHAIVVESFDYGYEATLGKYLSIVGNGSR
jgi:pyridoxine 5-phosphate synthase